MAAVVLGSIDDAHSLLEQGANPHVRELVPICSERYGVSPLHVASRRGDVEMVQLLLQAGGDKNDDATTVGTPLHEAVAAQSMGVVEMLLSSGGDPNAKTVNRSDGGETPLQMAVKSGATQLATLLLSHDAAVNYDTGAGTILDYAITAWHIAPDMLKILLDHGAQRQKVKISGQNPEAEFLVLCLCIRFPFREAVFMVGDGKIPEVERLVELGDSAVDACKLGFCGTRLVYDVLARIGSRASVDALLTQLALTHDMLGREMLAVPWESSELSCRSLSRIQHPSVRNAISQLEKLGDSKVGEVVVASQQALACIAKRFPPESIEGQIKEN
jgi:ankyrin repeat protein